MQPGLTPSLLLGSTALCMRSRGVRRNIERERANRVQIEAFAHQQQRSTLSGCGNAWKATAPKASQLTGETQHGTLFDAAALCSHLIVCIASLR